MNQLRIGFQYKIGRSSYLRSISRTSNHVMTSFAYLYSTSYRLPRSCFRLALVTLDQFRNRIHFICRYNSMYNMKGGLLNRYKVKLNQQPRYFKISAVYNRFSSIQYTTSYFVAKSDNIGIYVRTTLLSIKHAHVDLHRENGEHLYSPRIKNI